jgi:hypothetical protein
LGRDGVGIGSGWGRDGVVVGSGSGRNGVGMGSWWGRDRVGMGSGWGRGGVVVGSGSGRDRVGMGAARAGGRAGCRLHSSPPCPLRSPACAARPRAEPHRRPQPGVRGEGRSERVLPASPVWRTWGLLVCRRMSLAWEIPKLTKAGPGTPGPVNAEVSRWHWGPQGLARRPSGAGPLGPPRTRLLGRTAPLSSSRVPKQAQGVSLLGAHSRLSPTRTAQRWPFWTRRSLQGSVGIRGAGVPGGVHT